MANASDDRDPLMGQCFARTPAGEQAAIGGSELSRRAVTLLRLLDGSTPLAFYADHLKRYDVAALAEELLAAELIAPADAPGRGRRNFGRWSLGALLSGLRRDDDNEAATATHSNPAVTTGGHRVLPSRGEPDSANQADASNDARSDDQDEDDLTVRFMRRYAPSLKDDAEIDQVFRDSQDRSDDQ